MDTNAFVAEGQEYMLKTGLDTYLQQLVQNIVLTRPPDIAAHLELNTRPLKSAVPRADEEKLDACRKLLAQMKLAVPKPELEEGEEEDPPTEEEPPAEEEPNDGTFEDVIKTLKVMEVANIGLSDDELYRLHLSLKSLARKQPVESVRFWGKIYGTQKDYYVAEAKMKDGSREPPPAEEEPAAEDEEGEGAKEPKPPKIVYPPYEEPGSADDVLIKSPNQFVYYVTNALNVPWTRLPDVKPIHISSARSVKKLFTGSLTTPIYGCPPFPGAELELLRAQISRISHCCFLLPKQCFVLEGEEGEETLSKAEEFAGVNPAEMAPSDPPTGWAHACVDILPQGRCTFWQSAADEEAQAAAAAAAEEANQPAPAPPFGSKNVKPLRNIHEDEPIHAGFATAWTTRTYMSHVPEYAKAVARSNWWPGAAAVAFEKECYNLYIGWGTKGSRLEDSGDILPVPGPVHSEVEVELEEQEDVFLQPPKPPAAEGEAEE